MKALLFIILTRGLYSSKYRLYDYNKLLNIYDFLLSLSLLLYNNKQFIINYHTNVLKKNCQT